jgi:non-ribosomal peptide synthetase component F
LAPLIKGGQLHLLPASIRYDPSQITQIVAAQQITWLNCTPSAFYPLIEPSENRTFQKLASLRYVFLGGEPIFLTRLLPWLQSTACQAKVVNTYGPTECTDVCAAYLLDQPEPFLEQAIPIGKPIFNANVFILGKHLEVLPIGVAGELNSRLYKTGDLARYLPDGNIEYLNRIDNQIKIRGFRIELGEIEAVLAKHRCNKQ